MDSAGLERLSGRMQCAALSGLEEVHRRLTLAGAMVEASVKTHIQDAAKFLR